MILPSTLSELRRALPGRADRLRMAVVPVDLDPLELVRAGAHLYSTVTYFGLPGSEEIGGLGVAWRAAPGEADRFESLAGQVRGLPVEARVLFGFSFSPEGARSEQWDGFGPSAGIVPEVAVVRSSAGNHLAVALPAGASVYQTLAPLTRLEKPGPPRPGLGAATTIDALPGPEQFMASVSEAVEDIKRGGMEKVVLARSLEVRSDVAPVVFDLVERLRGGYPGCYVFGWQEGDAAFVGASPELLAERQGGEVCSWPLAGSAPRGEGEDDDRALGEALMASEKNRREHRLVVDDVVARLEAVATEVRADATPSLRKLNHVQHLSTQIRGSLSGSVSVVELAGLLHPTPAVGGRVAEEALAFIDKVEGIDRGWYAGGIGWTQKSGDGVVAVALRSALVRGSRAFLYAGAGIVGKSDPEAELDETRLKFRPMLDLLAAT